MTTRVDVLAVMYSVLGDLMAAQVAGIDTDTRVPELSASIDAVAELIEAEFHIDEMVARRNKFPCPGMDEHVEKARVRRSAALARVKGA
ncbi:hypothetical protein [Stenotrophomonas sepilia]